MTAEVFFDLDGTLTDPKTGITRCILFALQELGLDAPEGELTWCIGPPLLESLESLVGPALAPQALTLYRERFAALGWLENAVYPGIVELLEHLVREGRPVYVATSKPLVYAERIVRHFGLGDHVLRVFGSELDGTRSDKAELLRFALEESDAGSEATMIGDRRHDVVGAKANDLRSIGVTYGYGSRQELEAAGADAIAASPGAVLRLLA